MEPANTKEYRPQRILPDLRIKKLDWYIIRKFLTTFFFAIIALAVISCVIDYSEKVDNIVQKKAPLWVVLNYYKNFVPHITALLFPLFIFIATIFFTSQIAYKSEIIAMLSSGVSFRRFLRPYLLAACFLGAVSFIANHWIIPVANEQRVAFEDKYINDANYSAPGENVHLALSKDNFVYLQYFDFKTNTGTRFTSEKRKGALLTEKLMAENVRYDSATATWILNNVVLRKNDTLSEQLTQIPRLEIKYPFKPDDLNKSEAVKESLTTPQLDEFIETEKIRGREDLTAFYVERERRTAQPFAGLILTVIGACIASRKIRGGSGFHLAIGIALSAGYILLLQLSTTFSTKAGLNHILAVWIPNAVFGGVAFYLFQRQSK